MLVKPIFFALDGKTLEEFSFYLEKLKGKIYGVKVGLELFISEGPVVVEQLKQNGWKVFLDLKLHDITNTVKESTISASNLGVDYLTIHIASGSEALIEANQNKSENLKILGVSSALTSKKMDNDLKDKVISEFLIASECKIDGVICPPSELKKTSEIFNLLVTPGIRFETDSSNDQKNIATPKEAIEKGATYLVMGRSIKNNLSYFLNDFEL